MSRPITLFTDSLYSPLHMTSLAALYYHGRGGWVVNVFERDGGQPSALRGGAGPSVRRFPIYDW